MGNLTFEEALDWRYATKRMNGKLLPEPELKKILHAIRLAPTSRGLQPFKVIIVDDQQLKQKIRSVADDQPQVTESSHLLIFAAWSGVTTKEVDDFILFAATERGMPVEKLDKMKSLLVRDQLNMNDEQFYQWASKQSYLALAFALTAAAVNQIDAAAMEGFDPSALDDLLDLKSLGLRSTVLLALGYRDSENDWLQKLKKSQTDQSGFIYTISEPLIAIVQTFTGLPRVR